MKRTFIILLLFLTLLASRLFFIDNTNNITVYITLINSISLIIVIVSAIEYTYNILKEEINNRPIANELKKRYIKDIIEKSIILCYCSLLVLISLRFSSEKFNDSLSIITIGISLLDSEISYLFKKILKKWCRL